MNMNREESARIITACKIDGYRRITSVIFDINGVSPTLTTPSGGVIPKIIEMKEEPKIVSYSRDKKGKIENYHTKEVANTIHCSTGTRSNNLRPYRQDKAKSGVAELQTEFSESVGSTLTSARPNNVYGDTFPYRIRRLTPRECFRLMDVDDEDYDKIKNYVKGHRKNGKPMYISESQQYKLAGNSIVVACMEHIFEQLFFPSGRVTEPRQLDIFDII